MFFFSLIILIFSIFISVAFFSLLERKILSYLHFRKGPNKVFFGILQPFVDAMKLFSKDNRPLSFSKLFFFMPPIFMFFMSMFIWFLFPFWNSSQNFMFSLLYIYIFLGIGVYGLIFSGFISKSKYALLGALRAVCQSISYEVSMSMLFLIFICFYKSASFMNWLNWSWEKVFFLKTPLIFLFFFTVLAELNRSPFDLSEGESELVSGYSVEYGGVAYTFIFLSENIMIFFSSFLICLLFFNWMNNFYSFSWITICMLLIIIRGIVPRIRYDFFMQLCWKVITPGVVFLLLFYLILGEIL